MKDEDGGKVLGSAAVAYSYSICDYPGGVK
jgi:hypothetical protein